RNHDEDTGLISPADARSQQQDDARDAGGQAEPQKEGAGCQHFDAGEHQPEDPPVPELQRVEQAHHTFSQGPLRWAVCCPIASLASSLMPPIAPITLDASSGMKMTFWLGAPAMRASAST